MAVRGKSRCCKSSDGNKKKKKTLQTVISRTLTGHDQRKILSHPPLHNNNTKKPVVGSGASCINSLVKSAIGNTSESGSLYTYPGTGEVMTTLRLNSSQTVLRLIRLQRTARTTRTTLILPHVHCRNFNITALEAKRLAMEKQREQLYSKWSHSELITRILELEKSQET